MQSKREHKNNTYAKNIKGEGKHISEVESGRKGYYCLGCKEEMEARKGKIMLTHYFAHVPRNVTIERQCTYSDETYRHKIAKEILQRIKKIKVPVLYKYPPNNPNGRPQKLRESRFIEAHSVKIERQFYENESGEIQYGQKIDFEKEKGKNFLIQADAAFFDKDNKPILLIEIVATHGITSEKIGNLRKLGIDTIQVTVPKDSPEKIEECFYRTQRTKWIYNNVRETTTYIPVPERNNEGVLPIDKFQARLLKAEESYSCRQAQLRSLIRGIRKCLESERYRGAKQRIRGEFQRVERNTKEHWDEWQTIQAGIRNQIQEKFRLEEEAFEIEQRDFREYEEGLGKRYFGKIKAIRESQENYEPECQSEIEGFERNLESIGGNKASFRERMEEVKRERERIEQHFREEERQLIERRTSMYEDYSAEEERIENDKKNANRERERIVGRRKNLFETYGQKEAKLKREFKARENEIREEQSTIGEETKRKFAELREQVIDAIENRNIQDDTRIGKRVGELVSEREQVFSIIEGRKSIKTFEFIKEFLEQRGQKNWV